MSLLLMLFLLNSSINGSHVLYNHTYQYVIRVVLSYRDNVSVALWCARLRACVRACLHMCCTV